MNLVSLIDFLRDRLRQVVALCLALLALLALADVARVLWFAPSHTSTGDTAHTAPAAPVAAHQTPGAPSEAAPAAKEGSHSTAPKAHAAASHEAKSGFWQSFYHIAETWPVFWSVFGFIACVLIVYVSKWYGHLKVGGTEIMTREDYYNE